MYSGKDHQWLRFLICSTPFTSPRLCSTWLGHDSITLHIAWTHVNNAHSVGVCWAIFWKAMKDIFYIHVFMAYFPSHQEWWWGLLHTLAGLCLESQVLALSKPDRWIFLSIFSFMVPFCHTACYAVGYGSIFGPAGSDLVSPSVPAGPSLRTASLPSIPGLLGLVVALAILIIFSHWKKHSPLFWNISHTHHPIYPFKVDSLVFKVCSLLSSLHHSQFKNIFITSERSFSVTCCSAPLLLICLSSGRFNEGLWSAGCKHWNHVFQVLEAWEPWDRSGIWGGGLMEESFLAWDQLPSHYVLLWQVAWQQVCDVSSWKDTNLSYWIRALSSWPQLSFIISTQILSPDKVVLRVGTSVCDSGIGDTVQSVAPAVEQQFR